MDIRLTGTKDLAAAYMVDCHHGVAREWHTASLESSKAWRLVMSVGFGATSYCYGSMF
jgi:hypothetical protein